MEGLRQPLPLVAASMRRPARVKHFFGRLGVSTTSPTNGRRHCVPPHFLHIRKLFAATFAESPCFHSHFWWSCLLRCQLGSSSTRWRCMIPIARETCDEAASLASASPAASFLRYARDARGPMSSPPEPCRTDLAYSAARLGVCRGAVHGGGSTFRHAGAQDPRRRTVGATPFRASADGPAFHRVRC